MLKIKNVSFFKSAFLPSQFPDEQRDEIVFSGRSNVGKSSLINMLLGKKIAKTSQTPGKTRSINFFLVNNSFFFVDLPGYGFSKVSKEERMRWKDLVEAYILRNCIKLFLILVDARRGILKEEMDLLDFCSFYGKDKILVFTKADKLGNRELSSLRKSVESIKIDYVMTSAKEKVGKKELLFEIGKRLKS